jgi:hypothetical protein
MHSSTYKRLLREEREITLAAIEEIDEKALFFEEMGW